MKFHVVETNTITAWIFVQMKHFLHAKRRGCGFVNKDLKENFCKLSQLFWPARSAGKHPCEWKQFKQKKTWQHEIYMYVFFFYCKYTEKMYDTNFFSVYFIDTCLFTFMLLWHEGRKQPQLNFFPPRWRKEHEHGLTGSLCAEQQTCFINLSGFSSSDWTRHVTSLPATMNRRVRSTNYCENLQRGQRTALTEVIKLLKVRHLLADMRQFLWESLRRGVFKDKVSIHVKAFRRKKASKPSLPLTRCLHVANGSRHG